MIFVFIYFQFPRLRSINPNHDSALFLLQGVTERDLFMKVFSALAEGLLCFVKQSWLAATVIRNSGHVLESTPQATITSFETQKNK
jgi:hypothetical protein